MEAPLALQRLREELNVQAGIRLFVAVPTCLLALLLTGCLEVGHRISKPFGRASTSPPRSGDRLEAFSFSALSGRSLAWDAHRTMLDTGTEHHQPLALFLHVFQPDCHKCQALAKAMERLVSEEQGGTLAAVGITHRGDERATIDFVRDTGVSFPVAVGTGSPWAHTWGRGDPLYIVDREGRVVYMQVGYRDGDLAVWRGVLADLAAGRKVTVTRPERESLRAGDALPAVELTDLFSGSAISLTCGNGGVVFTDAEGRKHHYRATIGFYSRY